MSSSNSDNYRNGPTVSPKKAWKVALGELQLQLTSDIFEMYLHPTRFMAYEDGTFLVAVPNGFVKDWLDLRLNQRVKRTLRHIVNREVEIKYTVQTQPVREVEDPAPTPLLDFISSEPQVSRNSKPVAGQPLVADYTFATFIAGSSNLMAHAASVAVAEKPGGRYNPLFIYSGVGLGKTHLMHAIAHRSRQVGLNPVYISSEVFTNELITAIRTNAQDQFRAKYRTSDVLLVDDVQFLAGKPSTQEEFFHTFNALHESGRQVVLACDRPPKAMSALENRLRSRFEWGLIADIQAPDLEMRLAILQAKSVFQGVDVPNSVLERIAQLVPTNIRELEGALTKTIAHASFGGEALTAGMVDEILEDMVPRTAEVEPEEVLVLAARHFGVPLDELTGALRKRHVVRARQVAMYLLREDLDLSFAAIGGMLGGRDHATAMHGVRKISKLLETDDVIQGQVDDLRSQMTVPVPVPIRRGRLPG
ncbi:MAG: chromosomal replication initiator protein DnaA [Chloroflexota bacterium]|nr:chromosomal replication initiator protein DnaA [Chloroflexota bacterium]